MKLDDSRHVGHRISLFNVSANIQSFSLNLKPVHLVSLVGSSGVVM